MKVPWLLKQPWTDQIRHKPLWPWLKVVPNMLLTMKWGVLYPAKHDDTIEWISAEDRTTTWDNDYDNAIDCGYYPWHPTTLFESEALEWDITPDHVWHFYNISWDGTQYIDLSTKWVWRQVRMERMLSSKRAEFTLRRNPYPENWKPGPQWPQGVPWIKWDRWPQGVQGKQGKDSTVAWPKGEQWIQWPKWDPFTYNDFTEKQLFLLKGKDSTVPGPQGKQGEKWPEWPQGKQGEKWDSIKRQWNRNSGESYDASVVVHYNGSAWISIEKNINKEPWIDTQRMIFAQKWDFLVRHQ